MIGVVMFLMMVAIKYGKSVLLAQNCNKMDRTDEKENDLEVKKPLMTDGNGTRNRQNSSNSTGL